MTKREEVLNALFEQLKHTDGIKVLKNEPLPQTIPENGIVFLRDGNLGEPEILLSPQRFIYKHGAEIEIVVQCKDAQKRDAILDSIITKIGSLLQNNPYLDGRVDYVSTGQPEFILEAPDGAIPIKAAIIPIILEYVTTSSLT